LETEINVLAKRGREAFIAAENLAKTCVLEGCGHFSNSDGRVAASNMCTCDVLFCRDQIEILQCKADICQDLDLSYI